MEKVFEDTLDLWMWLFENSKQFTSKMSDDAFSEEIDKQLDNVCREIKLKGFAKRHGHIIKVENMF